MAFMRIRALIPFVAVAVTTKIASADLPPPNRCPNDATVSTPCTTDSGKEGTCKEMTRSRYLPPYGGDEPQRVVSKYMGCAEKAAAPPVQSAPPADAATSGNVPATPAPTKRGCSTTGSGATSFLGAALVAGFLFSLRRRRAQ